MLYSIQLIQVKRICCQLLNASYKHQLGCNSAVSSMKSVRQLLRLAVNSLLVQLKRVIGRSFSGELMSPLFCKLEL